MSGPQVVSKGARLSRCKAYRYSLWRVWNDTKPRVLFIGLNPSTADHQLDDPTLIRCMRFADTWGYGGVTMANLFAYRATEPNDMMSTSDPVGPRNDYWLRRLVAESALVVAAWGNHGTFMGRAGQIKKRFKSLHCLRLNASGEPAHPLYLPAHLTPFRMPPDNC